MPTTIEFPAKPPPSAGTERVARTVELRLARAQVTVLSFAERWQFLTPREQDVAKLLVFHDAGVRETAHELGISVTRVKEHTMTILRVLACTNVKRLALQMGIHIRAIVPEYKEEG